MRKSEAVRAYVQNGQIKDALRIAKTFRLGITKEQSDAMSMAYECLVHPRFYAEIGVDTEAKVHAGTEVLRLLYGSK